MKYQELEEKRNNLKKHALLSDIGWNNGTLQTEMGRILSKDGQLYFYTLVPDHQVKEAKKTFDQPINELEETTISKEEFKQLKKVLETEILTKQYESQVLEDAGVIIQINYQKKQLTVSNNIELIEKMNDLLNNLNPIPSKKQSN